MSCREGASDNRAPRHRDLCVIHLCTRATSPPDWASNGITFQCFFYFFPPFAANNLPAGATLNGQDATYHQTSSEQTGWAADSFGWKKTKKQKGPGDDEKPCEKHRQEVQEEPWQESPELPRGFTQRGRTLVNPAEDRGRSSAPWLHF